MASESISKKSSEKPEKSLKPKEKPEKTETEKLKTEKKEKEKAKLKTEEAKEKKSDGKAAEILNNLTQKNPNYKEIAKEVLGISVNSLKEIDLNNEQKRNILSSVSGRKILDCSTEFLREMLLTETNFGHKVNFYGNPKIDNAVGMGDLFGPETKFILCKNAKRTEIGVRDIVDGKVGYRGINTGKYIAIHSGDEFRPLRNAEENAKANGTDVGKSDWDQSKTEETQENYEEIHVFPTKKEEQETKIIWKQHIEIEDENYDITKEHWEQRCKEMGMSPDDLKNGLNLDKVDQMQIMDMSAREIWQLRKKLGPARLKKTFEKMGYDKIVLSKEKIFQRVANELKMTGKVFDNKMLKSSGFMSEAKLISSLLWQESRGKIFAVSHSGCLGLAQMSSSNYLKRWNFNPFDPDKAIKHCLEHLRVDYKRFGKTKNGIEKTIVAYNRGGGYVNKMTKKHGNNWHSAMKHAKYGKEGYDYLNKIKGHYGKYGNFTEKSLLPRFSRSTAKKSPIEKMKQLEKYGTLSHKIAHKQLTNLGCKIVSTSGRVNASRKLRTTSMEGIKSSTIQGFTKLLQTANINGKKITISGGTEKGHLNYKYSHWNGYKIDVHPNHQLLKYIKNKGTVDRTGVGLRYTWEEKGFKYRVINEGNHLDIEIVPV